MKVIYTLEAEPEDLEILNQSPANSADYFLTLEDVKIDSKLDALHMMFKLHPDEKMSDVD